MQELGTIVLGVLLYPFIAAWLVGLNRGARLAQLESEVAELRKALEALKEVPAADEAKRRPATDEQPKAHAQVRPVRVTPVQSAPPAAAPTAPIPRPASAPVRAADTELESKEDAAPPREPKRPGWLSTAMAWIFTGNLVAKVGLVILFIGVGFLLKYVAETVFVPIEVRLAGVVLGALALLGWGWRMRSSRREMGLPLQGTAIAILMLVVFGAYHRYELIPAPFAFALLLMLTAFTCLLAVLQESPWLAAFGITGGFASPLLLRTGEANHVALFSYYALLNAGVFALAIKRAWRPLNLLGFAFTFVVGTAWGGLHYAPDNYLSAQGFLLLFFLFYVAIAIAFARQQQTRLKDYVDATLVLGTPLLAFGLQTGLVKDKPFGLALSALFLGGFYLSLAILLWRQGRERWRVLVETFTALGVIFGTLAIPFAVDGRWTAGVWALEGAGFVWFGLRRQQRLTWMFGVLLQAGAWMGFVAAVTGLDPEGARTSNLWLGFLLLAVSTFAVARGFRQHASGDQPHLTWIANFCLLIAGLWLLGGAWAEAFLRASGNLLANLLTAGALVTAAILYMSGARLAWPLARWLAYAAQLAAALAMLAASTGGWGWMNRNEDIADQPLIGVLMIAVAAFATSRLSMRSPDPQTNRYLSTVFLLWGGIWWFGPALSIAAGRFSFVLPSFLGAPEALWTAMYAVGAAASALACARLGSRLGWTQLRWLGASSWGILAALTLSILAPLYGMRAMPDPGTWLAWAMLWGCSEYLLLRWAADDVPVNGLLLRSVHAVRTTGPWLAIWPAGSILIERWLAVPGATLDAAQQAGWATSSSWGNYLPTWAMMLVLAWLLRRSRAGAWPSAPVAPWYRGIVIPSGVLLMLALATMWNFMQDGAMEPLPYLPLLNPLDLTTGFALVLALTTARTLTEGQGHGKLLHGLQVSGVVAAYVWFNLILLRSAAQYRDIAYRLDALAASQFVQAMLSLVWCASALILMRFAATRAVRWHWCVGAVVLGVVVLKLFTFDLANSGSLARVVSFVGVGLLMVLVGYFAPFPKTHTGAIPTPQST
jgi:uncharacterized membrane protein